MSSSQGKCCHLSHLVSFVFLFFESLYRIILASGWKICRVSKRTVFHPLHFCFVGNHPNGKKKLQNITVIGCLLPQTLSRIRFISQVESIFNTTIISVWSSLLKNRTGWFEEAINPEWQSKYLFHGQTLNTQRSKSQVSLFYLIFTCVFKVFFLTLLLCF